MRRSGARDKLRTQTKKPITNGHPLNTCNQAISLLKRHSGQPIKPQTKHGRKYTQTQQATANKHRTDSDWLSPTSRQGKNAHPTSPEGERIPKNNRDSERGENFAEAHANSAPQLTHE